MTKKVSLTLKIMKKNHLRKSIKRKEVREE